MQVWLKLLMSYLVLTLATLLICAVGIRSAQKVRDGFHAVNEESVPLIMNLEGLRYAGVRVISSTMEYALLWRPGSAQSDELATEQKNELALYQQGVDDFRGKLAACARYMLVVPEEKPLYREMEEAGTKLLTLSKNFMMLQALSPSTARLLQAKEEFERGEKRFLAAVNKALDVERGELGCQEMHAFADVSRAIDTTGLLSALALALSLAVISFISVSVSRRLATMKKAALEVAAGRLDLSLPVTSGDEIGSVFEAFNHMVAALKESGERVAHSNGYLTSIIATMPDSLVTVSADGSILDVNPATQRIFGYAKEELVGRQFPMLFAEAAAGRDFVAGVKGNGPISEEETFFITRDGRELAVSLWAAKLEELQGSGSFLCICHDLTTRKRAELEIHQLAYYDHLTGLPNRALFLDRCNQALSRARRTEKELTLLFFDLDHFKDLNDTLGHDAGDRLLQLVAQRLSGILRSSDTLARFGGDEFVLLSSSVEDVNGAAVLAKKLLHSLSLPFSGDNREIFTSASIGIVVYPHDGTDSATLLKNADLAMYAAKEKGRNAYQFFSHELDLKAQERIFIEEGLRQALQQEDLLLHYQPQVKLGSGTVIGVEALARWIHPELGFIPPDRFIPVAEQTGMIRELGLWVLRTACKQCKKWHNQGFRIAVGVNVSIIQLTDAGFAELVENALEESGLEPEYLELELTESKLMVNAAESAEVLKKVKALGVKVAIDDFGTGYSSLSYLKDFAVDRLKIDRSFVRDLAARSDAAAIIKAIIAIGHNLGLKVIAEGIETIQEEAMLLQYQCDDAQGFYYAKPMGVADLNDYLAAGTPAGVHPGRFTEEPMVAPQP